MYLAKGGYHLGSLYFKILLYLLLKARAFLGKANISISCHMQPGFQERASEIISPLRRTKLEILQHAVLISSTFLLSCLSYQEPVMWARG